MMLVLGIQGLVEIFIVMWYYCFVGWIEQVIDVQCVVYQEVVEVVLCIGIVVLQQLVGDGYWCMQVVEEVVDVGMCEVWYYMGIGGGQWVGYILVDCIVEFVDFVVERFLWIVGCCIVGVVGVIIQGVEIIVVGGGGCCGFWWVGFCVLWCSCWCCSGRCCWVGYGSNWSSIDYVGIGCCGWCFGSRVGCDYGVGDWCVVVCGFVGIGGQGGGQEDQGESVYDVYVSLQQKQC